MPAAADSCASETLGEFGPSCDLPSRALGVPLMSGELDGDRGGPDELERPARVDRASRMIDDGRKVRSSPSEIPRSDVGDALRGDDPALPPADPPAGLDNAALGAGTGSAPVQPVGTRARANPAGGSAGGSAGSSPRARAAPRGPRAMGRTRSTGWFEIGRGPAATARSEPAAPVGWSRSTS